MKTLGKLVVTFLTVSSILVLFSTNSSANTPNPYQMRSGQINPLALPPGLTERAKIGWRNTDSALAENHQSKIILQPISRPS